MKVGEEYHSVPSRLRLGLTLIIMFVVISSPVALLFSPSNALANPSVTDTSSHHATLPMSEEHSSPPVSSPSTATSTPTIQAPLQIPRTLQSTDLVNSLAFYEVTFITSTAGAIDRIRMDFPTGTNIAAAGVIERVGIGGGTLLKSGSSITFDVTSPVSIPAGTFIRLEMFGIKNPINPSTTFTAMITTRDSGGNLIDGPSQTNVYTIKQIGTSDIAEGAITRDQVAPSFMKTVNVFDTPLGNAVGWNPDGVATQFTIIEPAAQFLSTFVTIEVASPVAFGFPNHFCDVVGHGGDPPNFVITCFSAPPDGSKLQYVVENIPTFVVV